MRPPRLCTLCSTKIREKDRLCATHLNIYKDQLVYDKEDKVWRTGPLTEPWLCGIIDYAEYEHKVELRDYGRVIPLEKIKRI